MGDDLDGKVQAQSLVDIVAERIEAAIISGDLQPGSKLSEQALAASLGVSRGPLREAIRRLEGRKFLQRTPNLGVRVVAFSVKDLSDVLQIREALEGLACALAAQNMPEADIAALNAVVDEHERQSQAQGGVEEVPHPLDADFHLRIIHGSGNERLIEMLCEDIAYLRQVYRHRPNIKPGAAAEAFEEHRDLIATLARRDPIEAELKMRRHFRKAWGFVDEQLSMPGIAS